MWLDSSSLLIRSAQLVRYCSPVFRLSRSYNKDARVLTMDPARGRLDGVPLKVQSTHCHQPLINQYLHATYHLTTSFHSHSAMERRRSEEGVPSLHTLHDLA